MEEILDVKYARDKESLGNIISLYENPEINETFGGFRLDRLAGAPYHFLITLNDKNIGFILLVKELENKNNLFLDIAILKKYRKQGYGKQALIKFKEKYAYQLTENIIAETKKDNLSINKIMNDLDFKLIQNNDETTNKYMFQK